ncbi:MAG TPA: WYL domain-containing protein [Pirellulales bacterium]|nr:WYL domain-containing protein [Pirellulales bacterium]
MAVECSVSRRTIFRDLEVMRLAGVPMQFEDAEQQYRIPGMNFLPPTNFTPEEALSLLVLCYHLGDRSGVPFHAPARSAALKLECALPERLREYLRDATSAIQMRMEPTSQARGAAPYYQQLIDAIRSRRSVRIEYDSFSDRALIRTKLSPYRLLFSRRSWYVFGRSSFHRQTRTFNVGRIVSLDKLDERFAFPRGFSIERQLRNAWHLIPEPGPDQDVVIRFEKLVAKNVAEVAWHKTQRLVWCDDGRLDFHVRVSGINEISWWILGYGDQAEVLQPPALRALVERRCRHLLARYAHDTRSSTPRASVDGKVARGSKRAKRASGRRAVGARKRKPQTEAGRSRSRTRAK